jgi:replication factor C subunit 1
MVPIKGRTSRRLRLLNRNRRIRQSLSDIQRCRHNPAALKRIRTWINGTPRKSLLVMGPSGCGKTTCVQLVGKDENYEVVYINGALFQHHKEDSPRSIENRIHEAVSGHNIMAQMLGLEEKPKLIVVDQVDQYVSGSGSARRIDGLLQVLRAYRIIVIANSTAHKKMQTIRNHCTEVVFKRPSDSELNRILEDVCDQVNLKLSIVAKNLVVNKARGDINQLLLMVSELHLAYIGSSTRKQITLRQVTEYLNSHSDKDIDDDNVFACAERLLLLGGNKRTMEQKLQIYDLHAWKLPMIVHENLPNYLNNSEIEKLSRASHWSSDGDLFEEFLRSDPDRMDKDLYIDHDLYASYSTLGPISVGLGRPKRQRKLHFSKIYGSENTRRAKQRKLTDVRNISQNRLVTPPPLTYEGMILRKWLVEDKDYETVVEFARKYGFLSRGEEPKAVAELLYEIAERLSCLQSKGWKRPPMKTMRPLIKLLDRQQPSSSTAIKK